MNKLKKFNGEVISLVTGVAALGTVILANLSVLSRHINISMPAAEELLRYVFVWVIMICTAIAYDEDGLIGITMLEELLEKKKLVFPLSVVRFINVLFVLFFSGFCCFYSVKITFLQIASNKLSPVMEIPMAWVSLGMAIGSLLWFSVATKKIIIMIRNKPHA